MVYFLNTINDLFSIQELLYSFIIFSYNSRKYRDNKKYKIPGVSDWEIEESLKHTDLSFWDEDEKDANFFIQRDRDNDIPDEENVLIFINNYTKKHGTGVPLSVVEEFIKSKNDKDKG